MTRKPRSRPSLADRRRPAAAKAEPPAEHPYPYAWVRLRSASQHPFIYQRMIAGADPAAQAGDVVAVYDRSGRFFGHGFYHDRSQIALRMLSYEPAVIDEGFFRDRLEQALAWRRRLLPGDDETNVCRLVHAEGDGLSGLITERYGDHIAIEVFCLGVFRHLDLIKRLLAEQTGINHFVVRADERIEKLEGFHIEENASNPAARMITVRENGLRFRVDLRSGHKTGFFCDQRNNRRMLADLCASDDVLDVCCYTGGFGIYAKRIGQAGEVTGVDLDEKAIALARKNAHLNGVRVQHVHADAFAYLRQMQVNQKSYGVVVLDPPKFIANRDEYQTGSRKYIDLNALGLSVVKPGGLMLTCSCSGMVSRGDFLELVKTAAGRVRRTIQIVNETGAAPDHPILASCPESGYLKAVWLRVW